MKKLLKIGIPVLVAVLVLIIGVGVVLAQNSTPVLTGSGASYDNGYSRCPQYTGPQYTNCPFAGNGGGWYGDNDASYQPPCHR